MTHLEYKAAKIALGIEIPGIWCSYFHISINNNKSYSSGRTKIPELLSETIKQELEENSVRVQKLVSNLKRCFPQAEVDIKQDSNDIKISIDDKELTTFKNEGKNQMCYNTYSFMSAKGLKKTLVFYPKNHWVTEPEKRNFDWVFWMLDRYSPRRIGPYFEELSSELITKVVLN
jgi:hypothetical protein